MATVVQLDVVNEWLTKSPVRCTRKCGWDWDLIASDCMMDVFGACLSEHVHVVVEVSWTLAAEGAAPGSPSREPGEAKTAQSWINALQCMPTLPQLGQISPHQSAILLK